MASAKVIGAAAAGAVLVGVVVLVSLAQRLPNGPEPIAWNKEACAHCRMHIGEESFAAQLQLEDGRVKSFDDPGCALKAYSELNGEKVHAFYFHDLKQQRWLTRDQVAFVSVSPTPMSYGFGAVESGTPGAITFDQALWQVRSESRKTAGPEALTNGVSR